MNEVVEIFGEPSKLRDETKRVNNKIRMIFRVKEVVFLNNTESSCVYKLLSKVTVSV